MSICTLITFFIILLLLVKPFIFIIVNYPTFFRPFIILTAIIVYYFYFYYTPTIMYGHFYHKKRLKFNENISNNNTYICLFYLDKYDNNILKRINKDICFLKILDDKILLKNKNNEMSIYFENIKAVYFINRLYYRITSYSSIHILFNDENVSYRLKLKEHLSNNIIKSNNISIKLFLDISTFSNAKSYWL